MRAMRAVRAMAASGFVCASVLATGCGDGGKTRAESGTTVFVEFTKRLVAAEPAGARGVADVKATAKAGDEVVVSGEIGGSAKPVVEGRAVFTLADPAKLTSCNRKPGDTCAQPWDYCCHTRDEITAATLTVEVRGADGRPFATDLGASGMKPLTRVVVKGKVGPRPDPRVLVVEASEVFVVR